MRQMGMYEREMGWAFWTWKLEEQLGELPCRPPRPTMYVLIGVLFPELLLSQVKDMSTLRTAAPRGVRWLIAPPPLSLVSFTRPACPPLGPLLFFPVSCVSSPPKTKHKYAVLCFGPPEKNEAASKYWSFSLAVEHGFIDTDYPHDACIHPPTTDWAEPLVTDGDSGGDDGGDGSAELAAVVEAPPEEQTGGGEGSATGMDFSAVSDEAFASPCFARHSLLRRVPCRVFCS